MYKMAGTITLELTGAGQGGIRPLRMIGTYDLKVVLGRFTFDTSYITGGESLAPSDIGLTNINCILFSDPMCSTSSSAAFDQSFRVVYDYDNNKILAMGCSAVTGSEFFSEVSNEVNLSTFMTKFVAIGY